ncbi:MAG: tetratricopeptide repeat protein [Desulfobacterales bacterium]
MYCEDKEVKIDYAEAARWFRKAAEQGHTDALKWLQTAAERKNPEAQRQLEIMYSNIKDSKEDLTDFNAIREAAEDGDIAAQFQLGIMYYEGEGISKDYTEAAKWFRKAAENGHGGAQCYMGFMYDLGEGGIKIRLKQKNGTANAQKRFASSVEAGTLTVHTLGQIYYAGKGVQDYIEAIKWFRKAAKQGYSEAEHQLFECMYYRGEGVSKDYTNSKMKFRKSR